MSVVIDVNVPRSVLVIACVIHDDPRSLDYLVIEFLPAEEGKEYLVMSPRIEIVEIARDRHVEIRNDEVRREEPTKFPSHEIGRGIPLPHAVAQIVGCPEIEERCSDDIWRRIEGQSDRGFDE